MAHKAPEKVKNPLNAVTAGMHGEEIKMIKESCFMQISRTEVEFLRDALSTDPMREQIRYAAITKVGDSYWLATTNTHALHAVKVHGDSNKIDAPVHVGIIDLRRFLVELEFTKNNDLFFDVYGDLFFDVYGNFFIANQYQDNVMHVCPVAAVPSNEVTYNLNWPKIVSDPRPKGDATNYSAFKLNAKYLARAVSIASSNYEGCIIQMPEAAENQPFILTPDYASPWLCKWFAVIMPMGAW